MQSPPNEDQIYNAILGNVPRDGGMYTEAQLRHSVQKYRVIFPVSDSVAEDILKLLQVQLSIKMDNGTVVVEQFHRPWLNARKAKIDQFFWERYRNYLIIKNKWSPVVANALDRTADEILDLAGDPSQVGRFKRKGLIVGDVQSGKTATYTAIACKAADAGYRLIVLLTGTIESLRRQTQIRLDEGFVGRDSSQLLQKNKIATKSLVGVGLLDGRRVATSFTSRNQDFNKIVATQLGFSIANSKVPVLMVCKKNALILENLRTWLESMPELDRCAVPLLLIDDEADSASINTSADRDNATKTNKEIRQLLKLFDKSAYVGVTATPFANVFIHPDSSHEMLGDDLFPSSFIYALEPPTNYIGPEKIFSEELPGLVVPVADAEDSLPIAHKIGHVIDALPESLSHAVRCFFVATTIRDLRGEGPTHRSMLVNVSRFTAVQERVREAVDEEVLSLQRGIRLFGQLPPAEGAAASALLKKLQISWSKEFSQAGFTWSEVQKSLNESTSPIIVTSVNQKAGSSGLDYQAHKESGLRVIAVGGNSLSRGLTLEGLSTSYFYRNSIMYDTLLQMGRWFGYRESYSDLCRLFISEDAQSWFTHITEATIDLRSQLRRMQELGLTPSEFGLKVRAHPDSLIVTARNKMRFAEDFVHFISLSEKLLETVRLLPKQTVLSANYDASEQFVKSLSTFKMLKSKRDWYTYGIVPKFNVAQYFKRFTSDPMNFNLQLPAIADFLAITEEPCLQEWDVTIVNTHEGEADAVSFAGLTVGPITRKLTRSLETASLLISGTKARVGPGGSESEALPDADIAAIKSAYVNKNIPDLAYRARRKRPLLLIYLVKGYELIDGIKVPFRDAEPPLVALGLSFPEFNDSDVATHVPYKVNVFEWKTILGTIAADDQEQSEETS